MSDKIILSGIEFFGYHGCSLDEKRRGQIFKVDAELNFDLSKAGATDNIADTVDYAQVLLDVEKIITGTPRNLIETVAEEIAATLLEKYSLIDSVKITLHKPYAPLPTRYDDAAVQITRSRK